MFENNLLIYKKKSSTEVVTILNRRFSDRAASSKGSSDGETPNSPKTGPLPDSPGSYKKLTIINSPSCFSPISTLKDKRLTDPKCTPITRSLYETGVIKTKKSIFDLANEKKAKNNIEPIKSNVTSSILNLRGLAKEENFQGFPKNEQQATEKKQKEQDKREKEIESKPETQIVDCEEDSEEFTKKLVIGEENNDKIEAEDLKKTISFEGELLRAKAINKTIVFEEFYLAIINTSIYYYDNKDTKKENYLKSHFLGGCFIKENKAEEVCKEMYYSFTIIFAEGKTKQYYSKSSKDVLTWIKALRKALNYKNFFEYYEMGNTVGEGQFGVVKSGKNKKSGEVVAIKILKKDQIKTKEDWELIKTEVGIMKISTHQNIIKFLDHFENSEYIFIVMEFLKLGSLQDYLEKKKFKISEKTVSSITYQIADALSYLHRFGVIHRDLKPDNIMLSELNNEAIHIKIMDFGLSKILGNKERTVEGYGSLAFVAPEIIIREPYNNSVDIWSLGVIVYYMISGTLPFMSEKGDMDEMAVLICKKELAFNDKFLDKSIELQEFIANCLVKRMNERATIDRLLNHQWLKKKDHK